MMPASRLDRGCGLDSDPHPAFQYGVNGVFWRFKDAQHSDFGKSKAKYTTRYQ